MAWAAGVEEILYTSKSPPWTRAKKMCPFVASKSLSLAGNLLLASAGHPSKFSQLFSSIAEKVHL
jgi:hypothetical protein